MKKLLLLILAGVMLMVMAGCLVGDVEPEKQANSDANISFKDEIVQFDIEENDGDPRYNAIVQIENTGTVPIDIGYTSFDVEDAKGHLVAAENSSIIYAQPSVIAPGETGYYYAARVELPNNINLDDEYHLVYTTQYIEQAETDSIVTYPVEDVSFPDDDYSEIIGRVIDNTGEGAELVDVLCICYDANHNIVTMGGTVVDLEPAGKSTFDISNYAAYGLTNITEYEIIARKIS